jgi:hypothetical protein
LCACADRRGRIGCATEANTARSSALRSVVSRARSVGVFCAGFMSAERGSGVHRDTLRRVLVMMFSIRRLRSSPMSARLAQFFACAELVGGPQLRWLLRNQTRNHDERSAEHRCVTTASRSAPVQPARPWWRPCARPIRDRRRTGSRQQSVYDGRAVEVRPGLDSRPLQGRDVGQVASKRTYVHQSAPLVRILVNPPLSISRGWMSRWNRNSDPSSW